MKARETQYKGCLFRSRTEARWAVFFDALDLDWTYEPEGYVLSNGQTYLPDFIVREKGAFPDIYVEVKPPKALQAQEQNKIWLFAGELVGGSKNAGVLVVRSDPLEQQAYLFGSFNGEKKSGPLVGFADFFCKLSGKSFETVEAAAIAARSARFEHNQVGAPDQWKRG